MECDALDLSVEWSALFHRRLVGKIAGYTKPIIRDLRVVKNKGKDRLTTRVEFAGDLKKSEGESHNGG